MSRKKDPRKDDLEWLLQQVQFRRFLLQMFEECSVFTDSYVTGDTHASARESGKRAKALELYARVMYDHFEWYVVMMREARNERDEKDVDLTSVSE